MARRFLYKADKNFGEMGKPTDYQGFNVGDFVYGKAKKNTFTTKGIVVESEGEFTIMNEFSTPLTSYEWMYRLLPAEYITDDIVYYLHKLQILECKKMTQKEIEHELGYPIEIVGGEQ